MSSLNPNGNIQRRLWKTLHKYKDVVIEKAVQPIEKIENNELSYSNQLLYNNYYKEENLEEFYGKDGKIVKRCNKRLFSKKV